MSDSNVSKEIMGEKFNPEYYRHYIKELQLEYAESKIDWDEMKSIRTDILNQAARHFSRSRDLPLEDAFEALSDIVDPLPDKPLDVQETLQILLKSLRKMAPQVDGIVQREKDQLEIARQLRALVSEVQTLRERLSDAEDRIDQQKMIFQKAVQLVQLEAKPPTIWNVITCTLISLKTSLLNSLGFSSKN